MKLMDNVDFQNVCENISLDLKLNIVVVLSKRDTHQLRKVADSGNMITVTYADLLEVAESCRDRCKFIPNLITSTSNDINRICKCICPVIHLNLYKSMPPRYLELKD